MPGLDIVTDILLIPSSWHTSFITYKNNELAYFDIALNSRS